MQPVYAILFTLMFPAVTCLNYENTWGNLTQVPTDIPGEAIKVDLTGNHITNLPSGVFSHLSVCTKLNVSNNDIESIEVGVFPNSLVRLNLEKNELTDLSAATFQNLNKLEFLNLANNKLTTLRGDMWTGLNSLTELNIEDNKISTIEDGAFSSLSTVETLSLSGNSLKDIRKEMWQGLTSLRDLSLSKNQIECIAPGMFSDLQNIEILSLIRNELRTLNKTIFNPDLLTRISYYPGTPGLWLDLAHNPFQCEEDLCWLFDAAYYGYIEWYASDCEQVEKLINGGCEDVTVPEYLDFLKCWND